jgi:hypothetical protein
MATLAPVSAKFERAVFLARHREHTEQAVAAIREDAFLTDRERARRITQVVAEANARVLARAASRAF